MHAGCSQRVASIGRRCGDALIVPVEHHELVQPLRDREVLAALNSLNVLENLALAQREIGVLEPFLESGCLCLLARVDAVGQTIDLRLTSETIDYRFNSIGLVGLDLELQFHGYSLRLL